MPWRLRIVHPGGFGRGAVTVAVNADYFSDYESQRFFPEPSTETRDGRLIYLSFDPPPGDTLTIDYDAYIQPTSQRGGQATVTVLTDGHPRVTLHATTHLLP